MNEKPIIDVFQLCWDVIRSESSMHNVGGTYFNSEHCKIIDIGTIDTNFDTLENRLAYTYKYGCYNILFFEKCFLNFLNECTDFDTVIPLNELKVCSLSDGPGFDIVGLLCALCKLNKRLTSFPLLNAVNISNSWLTLYKTLIGKAHEILSLKYPKCIPPVKDKNISLIQGDIFSKLTRKNTKCITKSNVLLMVKVFFSSKFTPKIFKASLRIIFLSLQPGALVFFIGSEKDMKNFSKYSFLSNYVKTIYGPQKVTLDNIIFDINISNVVGQKPVDSGYAEFIVWQKRNATDIEALIEDSKKNNEKKKALKCTTKKNILSNEKNVNKLLDEAVVDNDCGHSNDSESELSYISGSKLSEISSVSLSLSRSDSIYSVDNVSSILDKGDLDFVNNGERENKMNNLQQNPSQLCSDHVISDSTNQTPREFYTDNLVNMSAVNEAKNLTCANYEDFDLMMNTSTQNSIKENNGNLNLKYVVSTSTNRKFPSCTQCMSKEKINESCCIKETKAIQPMNKSTDQHDKMNVEKNPEIIFKKNRSLSKQTGENLMQQTVNITASLATDVQKSSENVQDMELPNLPSLVQRCENLVTALEKLTVSIKSDIDRSKNYSNCSKKFCQAHKISEFSYHCCCCVKITNACCCQKCVTTK